MWRYGRLIELMLFKQGGVGCLDSAFRIADFLEVEGRRPSDVTNCRSWSVLFATDIRLFSPLLVLSSSSLSTTHLLSRPEDHTVLRTVQGGATRPYAEMPLLRKTTGVSPTSLG